MENNIIIIGGGFGGLRAALDLSRSRAKKMGYRLILLNKNDFHIYAPLLYEVASACSEHQMSDKTMAKGVGTYLAEYGEKHGFEFYKGEVERVNIAEKKVILRDGSSLGFQALLFAVGAETDFFGVPGLFERAVTLKNLQDALRIRKKIMDWVMARERAKEVQFRIMIGGGGATGVETAAEMAVDFRHLEREGKIGNGEWSITLVEATPRVLSMLPVRSSERVRARLEDLGVKVLRDTCIKRVEAEHIILAPRPLRDGERVEELLCDFAPEAEKKFEAELLIWAGGIKANPLLANSGLSVDRKGRVAVSDTLEVLGKERENIYVIGDCAALSDPKTGAPVPALAQVAIAEARVAAKNIIYDLDGFGIREHFKFRTFPIVTPLGGKNAIAVVFGVQLSGFAGWLARQAADLLYFLSILPFFKALKLWLYGAWVYIKND